MRNVTENVIYTITDDKPPAEGEAFPMYERFGEALNAAAGNQGYYKARYGEHHPFRVIARVRRIETSGWLEVTASGTPILPSSTPPASTESDEQQQEGSSHPQAQDEAQASDERFPPAVPLPEAPKRRGRPPKGTVQ